MWSDKKHEPAARTEVINPIRVILEREMKPPADHPLPMINLGLGEPSKANGFTLPQKLGKSVIESINSETNNGYTQASGALPAREAVAKKFSKTKTIDPNHVFLTFGCSGSIYNAVAVLWERGDRLLVPKPGFPLCQPIC